MNELSIFSMLAQICRAYPVTKEAGQELICKRPQAFAVLENLTDLDKGNLGKSSPHYTSAPYFFSYSYEDKGRPTGKLSYEYPLVAMAYDQFSINIRDTKTKHRYNIGIFDQNEPAKCDPLSYCRNRAMEEQSSDLKTMLEAIVNQFAHWYYAFNEQTGESGLFHEANVPENYRAIYPVCDMVTDPEVRAEYIRGVYSDDLSGVFASIEFDFTQCHQIQSWNYKDAPGSLHNPNCEAC